MGDDWRCHWDSLRLYSPARTAALPGMRFPAPPAAYPTKDDMADFLETYASTFELPVQTGVRVRRLARENGGYLVTTDGPSFRCDNVVVASGTFGRTPYVPDFAGRLDPGIVQLHSSAYQHRAQRPDPRRDPLRLDGRAARAVFPVLFFAAKHVLTIRTQDAAGPQAAPRGQAARRPAAPGQAGRPHRGPVSRPGPVSS